MKKTRPQSNKLNPIKTVHYVRYVDMRVGLIIEFNEKSESRVVHVVFPNTIANIHVNKITDSKLRSESVTKLSDETNTESGPLYAVQITANTHTHAHTRTNARTHTLISHQDREKKEIML